VHRGRTLARAQAEEQGNTESLRGIRDNSTRLLFAMAKQTRYTRSAFDQRFSLPDWRVIGHSIVADLAAPTFSVAAEFVSAIAKAADAVQHHPDIDLRYPGTLRITLTTHAANGLTDLDAALAQAISNLAAEHQIKNSTTKVAVLDIAIDALDIATLLPFWKAVLGYVDEPPANPGDPVDALIDPLRIGPPLWFQQMDAPRPQRNRIHLDLKIPHDLAEQRIALAIAAGGKLLSATAARSFWVLADPEGNEVCICTWQDRD
jgi:4a-hydroxytetrahydrobiopterin dehydratase